MKKFGLIGHPIAHSLSPALFKAAYGGRYTYDLIEGDDFEESYGKFLEEYDAINITAPFKEQAYRKADLKSVECEAIGAANILTKNAYGQISADNSDVMGVIGAITAQGNISGTGTQALIVGCGGAAMAAAYATCSLGYSTTIINRNEQKAREFAHRLRQNGLSDITAAGLDSFCKCFRRASVIIYNLPVTIPQIAELSNRDIKGGCLWRKDRKLILEANYKDPAFTPDLMESLRSANSRISFISGKEWLLQQAVGAYRIFTGEEPDIQAMRKVIG